MSWITALRLLTQCPAILRVGVELVREIVDAIDEGRSARAANLAREAAVARARGVAAGKAAAESSRATERR